MSIIHTVLADCTNPADPIGCISPPSYITPGVDPTSGLPIGVMTLSNSLLKLVFIVAGLWAFLNLIVAGFGFMNAGGDAKMVTKAWNRIWQSLLGLLIIVVSFVIAAIIGMLLFKDPTAILQPKLLL